MLLNLVNLIGNTITPYEKKNECIGSHLIKFVCEEGLIWNGENRIDEVLQLKLLSLFKHSPSRLLIAI